MKRTRSGKGAAVVTGASECHVRAPTTSLSRPARHDQLVTTCHPAEPVGDRPVMRHTPVGRDHTAIYCTLRDMMPRRGSY
ncbi:unnamed protein product, partial [Iphiclides podalirius]